VLTPHNAASHNRYQPHPAEPAQHTTCNNTCLVLLEMGIMMPETCWESTDNKHLTVASCWFSLSLHDLLTMHGHRNLKVWLTFLRHNNGTDIRRTWHQVAGYNVGALKKYAASSSGMFVPLYQTTRRHTLNGHKFKSVAAKQWINATFNIASTQTVSNTICVVIQFFSEQELWLFYNTGNFTPLFVSRGLTPLF